MKTWKRGVVARTRAMVALAVTASVITACGGGGSGAAPAAQNAAPTVSAFATQSVNQDTPVTADFTVTDDGGADALMLSVSSSDPSIVPVGAITLSGSGTNRTVSLLPAEDATGRVNIQIAAKDAQGNVGVSILPLTVNAVNQSIASYTSMTFAKSANDTPVQVSGFTFVQDADDEGTFAPLLQ
ncbi:MAG TPA: hypothetical protein VFS52_21990 [Steroidobacteraceae bacterium]|jgi:hypothetical protein|nr:hypothetical protein [Steroidobacteraceae bacterium]